MAKCKVLMGSAVKGLTPCLLSSKILYGQTAYKRAVTAEWQLAELSHRFITAQRRYASAVLGSWE